MRQLHVNIMADDSERKLNELQDFPSTKAALIETLNKCKKWQVEQLKEFQSRQLIEGERLLRLPSESQKDFEQMFGNNAKSSEIEEKPKSPIPESSNASSVLIANDLDNCDSVHEHSITGHLQRCFDDSSRSNISVNPNKVPSVAPNIPIFSEIRNSQFLAKMVSENEEQLVKGGISNDSPAKTKRPFLRKRAGLLRYMPKSAVGGQVTESRCFHSSNNVPRKTVHLPQKTLKLKPAVRKTDVPSRKGKHIRFDVPFSDDEENAECLADNDSSSVPDSTSNAGLGNDNKNKCSPSSVEHSSTEDASKSGNENLDLFKENKELEEFEMLETYAQNTSFNSDSSVVQKYLQGDLSKPFSSIQNNGMNLHSENVAAVHKEVFKSPSEISTLFKNIGLSKCLEEVQARKQGIQKVISDLNPRIQSLQKEITSSEKENHDESDASDEHDITLEDLNSDERALSPALAENDPNKKSIDFEDFPKSQFTGLFANEVVPLYEARSYNGEGIAISCSDQGNHEDISNAGEGSISEVPEDVHESKRFFDGKSRIHEKLVELQNEIERYQELNAKLTSMCKERDEILRKLQKERDDFNKNKEAEKKKLEGELQEERRQIKRQKETFMRFQKLRKDNPTRKERDEMNALRQEVEKLQEELRRQKIKYASDSRKWKARLDAAEKDRDTFKLENVKLDEQCQDLLAALKARMKKKPESKLIDDENVQENIVQDDIQVNQAVEDQAQAKELISDLSKETNGATLKGTETKKTGSEVRFNLPPNQDKHEFDVPSEKVSNKPDWSDKSCPSQRDDAISNINGHVNGLKDVEYGSMSSITVSIESEVKVLEHNNRTEKIFPTGEREIVFHSGTRKVISADGKSTKFFFYNGDVKEILPDKQEIYRYKNGVTETLFPDGLKVTEFPNGQTQHHYPSGQKEIRYPDGVVHTKFADGSEEIHSKGKVTKLSADGTKTIEYENGQKEIKTATYERVNFPDGSVKIRYKSGRQETRYPNGRIRIKCKEGKLIFDTKYPGISKG